MDKIPSSIMEIGKFFLEICGTLGTALLFFYRKLMRDQREKIELKQTIQDMQDTIAELQANKSDRSTTELMFKSIGSEMSQLRESTERTHERITDAIEGLTKTLHDVAGQVKAGFKFLTKQP